jgi:uncharacterized protein
MLRCVMVVVALLLFPAGAAEAQTLSPEAMSAARTLVTTLKLPDQYKALLPIILLGIKQALVQDRPEIEQDYNLLMPEIADAYTPYYNSMVDAAATVYASAFTADELREIDAFYRGPTGQKLLQNSHAITEQVAEVGRDGGRKAADDLRARLTEALRQKGHKLLFGVAARLSSPLPMGEVGRTTIHRVGMPTAPQPTTARSARRGP